MIGTAASREAWLGLTGDSAVADTPQKAPTPGVCPRANALTRRTRQASAGIR